MSSISLYINECGSEGCMRVGELYIGVCGSIYVWVGPTDSVFPISAGTLVFLRKVWLRCPWCGGGVDV